MAKQGFKKINLVGQAQIQWPKFGVAFLYNII